MGPQFVQSFYFAVPHPRLLLGSRGRPIGRSPASASQSSSLTDSAIFQSALIFCRKCDWSWVSTLVLDWHEGEGSQKLMSTMQAKCFVSSPVSACVCATWRTSFLISARRSAKVKFCHENPAFWHLTHLTAFCKTKQLVLGLISSIASAAPSSSSGMPSAVPAWHMEAFGSESFRNTFVRGLHVLS